MARSLARLARRLREAHTARSLPPERFKVVRTAPLGLDGLDTDVFLDEDDDDAELGALEDVTLEVGDVVLVQPEAHPDDAREVVTWTAVTRA